MSDRYFFGSKKGFVFAALFAHRDESMEKRAQSLIDVARPEGHFPRDVHLGCGNFHLAIPPRETARWKLNRKTISI